MELNTQGAQQATSVVDATALEILDLEEIQLAFIGGGTGEATPY